MIVIENLVKRFGDNVVLNGVNLEIKDGQTTVVIGPSGCGKTVLLKHIIGLLKPDEGAIRINGEDITKLNFRQLSRIRKKFGMVFQSSALFDSMTVYENVGLALTMFSRWPEERIREKVQHCLSLVGLEGVENLYPAELSGGMKKRVAIARALALDPHFILYDEPTTGLDPIMADTINKLINKLKTQLGVTSVAVTHDMVSAYTIGDKIAMLHEGKILFEGTPEEIRRSTHPVVRQFIEGQSLEFKLEMG